MLCRAVDTGFRNDYTMMAKDTRGPTLLGQSILYLAMYSSVFEEVSSSREATVSQTITYASLATDFEIW